MCQGRTARGACRQTPGNRAWRNTEPPRDQSAPSDRPQTCAGPAAGLAVNTDRDVVGAWRPATRGYGLPAETRPAVIPDPAAGIGPDQPRHHARDSVRKWSLGPRVAANLPITTSRSPTKPPFADRSSHEVRVTPTGVTQPPRSTFAFRETMRRCLLDPRKHRRVCSPNAIVSPPASA